MSTFRFVLLAVGLFVLAFVGMSWANKRFPVMALRVLPAKSDARIPTLDESKTSQSDGNSERDKLRLELLQASDAYKLSPCDGTTKKNLVAALTNYTQAWYAVRFCQPGAGGCPNDDDDRQDAAVAAFKTPADIRVHRALRDAIDQGGIALDDFPRSIRDHVFGWSGPPPEEPEAACLIARHATRR
jgi:hypothetical protein